MSQKSKRLFGRAVKLLCAREGYSQKGLAEHLDSDDAYVSKICAGKVLPLKYIDSIAIYLEVPISRLFMEEPLTGADPPPSASKPLTAREALKALASEVGLGIQFTRRKRSPKTVKKN